MGWCMWKAPVLDFTAVIVVFRGFIALFWTDLRGEWSYYDSREQIDALLEWLNDKGIRESKLKATIAEEYSRILSGIRKRQNECSAALAETFQVRRSTRAVSQPIAAKPFMKWTNKM